MYFLSADILADRLLAIFSPQSVLTDYETKANTESPSSDSRSQDMNEDSCETQVRDDQGEKSLTPIFRKVLVFLKFS